MSDAGQGIGFWVREGVAPTGDPAWALAGPAQRKRFWGHVAALAVAEYERERELGVDRFGRKLRALSPKTIARRRSAMTNAVDPYAQPFVPGHAESRAIQYLRAVVTSDGVWLRWRHDPRLGTTFGQLLFWHAHGMTTAPIRDVLGISQAGQGRINDQAARWWLKNRLTLGTAGATARVTTGERIAFRGPPGLQAVSRAQRGPSPFDRGQTVVTRQARIGIDTTSGGRLGPGATYLEFLPRPITPPPTPPRPRPPVAPTTPTVATVRRDTGVPFTAPRPHLALVVVDVLRVDLALRRDPGDYVGSGGDGPAKPGAYANAAAFLLRAIAGEISEGFHAPRLALTTTGGLTITDGRHRWAALRDQGLRWAVVAVEPDDVAEITARFGPGAGRRSA